MAFPTTYTVYCANGTVMKLELTGMQVYMRGAYTQQDIVQLVPQAIAYEKKVYYGFIQ